MPKVGAATKAKKRAQYDVSSYKREKGVLRRLANRRQRHTDVAALHHEVARDALGVPVTALLE